jgi:hypothetical protein
MLLFDDSLNLFLLLNKELFARLKSPTTGLGFAFGVG